MNIIMVQHFSGKDYAFRVPDEIVPYAQKGQIVLVETARGVSVGVATTDVISGKGSRDIAIKNGAYEPLKPVIGIAHNALVDVIKNDIKDRLINYFRS